MQQYNQIKTKYPDAMLLFRVGDFYETFGQDAIKAANALGITLTKRSNGAAAHQELAGFPYHALDTYLPKLVQAGFRVAICEQLEDPKQTKTIVKRGVTELITPGTALNDKLLNHKQNNFLAAVHFEKDHMGVAFLDASTGEFFSAEGDMAYIANLLQSFQPSEVLFDRQHRKRFFAEFAQQYYSYPLDEWVFQYDYSYETLTRHFGTTSLKGFGVEELRAGVTASGAILHYLKETQHPDLQHISTLSRLQREEYVWLDRFTIRNLELVDSAHGASLLETIDHTSSPMGARMLKRWIVLPLVDADKILARQSVVEALIKSPDLYQLLQGQVKQIGDLERLISKVPMGRINPRELRQLQRGLAALEPIKEACLQNDDKHLQLIGERIDLCATLRDRIADELSDEPPVALVKGHVMRDGISPDLDELRTIINSSKSYIAGIQQREMERTGITSLKVGFNNVFGYYLEVRNTHKDKVPEEWVRKQTLVNAERYITDELKQAEEKILGAEDKVLALEAELFQKLVAFAQEHIRPVQSNAQLVATIDCLLSFAHSAQRYNYRRPQLVEDNSIEIKEGRHPVIEQQLPTTNDYIPNDIQLDTEEQQIIIITGPNMAGKSALLRQTALICLMAQIGSFVPATSAKLGITDKIFTRVGASDNISSGESTFMVEMNETASIVNNISDKSLILLDEIGRGTSTYDGISIAWSIAEYLHNNGKAQPKTLFATHYHELNELANKFHRIQNYNVATKEVGQKVIFLRKLEKGGSHHSFGIHVAQMAGMPKPLVNRAKEILKELEQKSIADDIADTVKSMSVPNYQLNIFQVDDPHFGDMKKLLDSLDVNTLTPVEALLKLNELKELMRSIK